MVVGRGRTLRIMGVVRCKFSKKVCHLEIKIPDFQKSNVKDVGTVIRIVKIMFGR